METPTKKIPTCVVITIVDLGERLKSARELSGLSATEVSRVLGCSLTNYTYLETGRNKGLKAEQAQTLTKLFNVRLEWLLFGEEPIRPSPNQRLVDASQGLSEAQLNSLLSLIETMKK